MHNDKNAIFKKVLQYHQSGELPDLLPQLNSSKLTILASQIAKYLELDQDIRQKKDFCRNLSRQIGEAKKLNDSIEHLLAKMRHNSAELKVLEAKCETLKNEINYFLPDVDNTAHKTQSCVHTLDQAERYTLSNVNKNDFHIVELQNKTSEWDRYVERNPSASIYHLTEWRAVIQEVFGHKSYYYYAQDNTGSIIGILPMIRLKSRLFGDFMVSMPYFNYGGAVGDNPVVEDALIQHANIQAGNLGLEHIEYRDDISRPNLQAKTDKVNMILPLPSNEGALWQSFPPKLRSQIKRPQRENTEVKQGGIELIDDFYDIFAHNMRDLGTPVYSKQFFIQIINRFPQHTTVITVYLDNYPVAGAFLIGYKHRLEIPWASTIRRANSISINMLMYWEVLRFAIQKKYTCFDFGRSSVDAGTFKFKKQWGAEAKQLYWHYWLNNQDIPALNPSNPKYKLMINIWKKLPIWLTKKLGPQIVKNLP